MFLFPGDAQTRWCSCCAFDESQNKPDRLDTNLERFSNRLGAWSLFEREGPAEAWPLGTS
jgi:hypothetical protein